MKNVTITLDDDVAAWARVEAAKRGQSLSRFVSETLTEKRAPAVVEQLEALGRFLDGPGWPGVGADLPKRDELYDRPALRRHERSDLRDGPRGSRTAGRSR
jgi:hypothetical protein